LLRRQDKICDHLNDNTIETQENELIREDNGKEEESLILNQSKAKEP
jgi:hypothetical protein